MLRQANFLKWLLLTSICVVVFCVAEFRFNALSYLHANDGSYIVAALAVVHVVGTVCALLGQLDNVRFLANMAPMLGLAGSIYGMMVLFSSGFDDPTRIAQGLGTALNTTLAGIVVAVILSTYNQILKRKQNEAQCSHA